MRRGWLVRGYSATAGLRRGTTRYSTRPLDSSSSARVVSFFSRGEERSRGNSLRTRANFAATVTARYLLVACFATSTGVKTCIVNPLCVSRFHASARRRDDAPSLPLPATAGVRSEEHTSELQSP